MKTYICFKCDKEFEGLWTDEESIEEAKELWNYDESKSDAFEVVCDACFKNVMNQMN